MKVNCALGQLEEKRKKKRCDWCGKIKASAHRCRNCKSKVYCSQGCLDEDWKKVHSKVCGKGSEEDKQRKMKMDPKTRKEESKKAAKQMAKYMKEDLKEFRNLEGPGINLAKVFKETLGKL